MSVQTNTSNELGSIANNLNEMAVQLSGISATIRMYRDYGDAIEGAVEAISLIATVSDMIHDRLDAAAARLDELAAQGSA
jgi:methyl-accepting chemotaxis protein